jgi:hypothetical protein
MASKNLPLVRISTRFVCIKNTCYDKVLVLLDSASSCYIIKESLEDGQLKLSVDVSELI